MDYTSVTVDCGPSTVDFRNAFIATCMSKRDHNMKTYYKGKEITALFIIVVFIVLIIYTWIKG